MPESAQDAVIDDGTPRQQRMTRRGGKSRSIHVYLKPGMREDDLLLALWKAFAKAGRPQEAYRRLLIEGVKRMVENGDMPLSIMKDPEVAAHLEVLGDLERDRRQPYVVVAAPHQIPGHAPAHAPASAPASPLAAFAPAPAAPQPDKPKAKKGLDPNLM